jgi:proteasome component ECM29
MSGFRVGRHSPRLHSSHVLCRFASIAKLAGKQLEPYVAQLVPKLYRYQYDPNPRVRDAMTHIWHALVDEPKQALDEHFAAVVKELLREMGGRLWRNREAACLALADLLQARHMWGDDLGLRLGRRAEVS